MNKLLAPAFLLFAAGSVWAQADCAQTVAGSDVGCTHPHDCLSTAGCTVTTFTASCTGEYNLDAWTECPGGSCALCRSCVNIFKHSSGTRVGDCHTHECDRGDCNSSCIVSLEAGVEYDMYVCLIPCPGAAEDCSDCGDNCKAYGCVRYGSVAPCY